MEAILPGSSGEEPVPKPIPVIRMDEPVYQPYQETAGLYQPLTPQGQIPGDSHDHVYERINPATIRPSPSASSLAPPLQEDQQSSIRHSFDNLVKVFNKEQIKALKRMFDNRENRPHASPMHTHSPRKQTSQPDEEEYCYTYIDLQQEAGASTDEAIHTQQQNIHYEDISTEEFQSHLASAHTETDEAIDDKVPKPHYENLDQYNKPLQVKPEVPPKPKTLKRPERTATVIKDFSKSL